MLDRYEQEAADFCDAIRMFADREDALENLQLYLSMHFDVWMKMYANCPENLAGEMRNFAMMYD